MAADQLPTPDEARASLDAAHDTRSAVLAATKRPLWLQAGLAAVIGVYFGLMNLGGPTAKLAGGVVYLAGFLGFIMVRERLARRHGELVDNRFIGAAAVRVIPALIALVFLVIREPPQDTQPWYSIGLGLVIAFAVFAYMRWADRYKARRLTADDYDRANLL